jgi:hypothetical protein
MIQANFSIVTFHNTEELMSNKMQTTLGPIDTANNLSRTEPRHDLPTMPDPSTSNPEGGRHLPTTPDPVNDPPSGQELPTEPDPSRKPVRIVDPPIVDEDEEQITSPGA